MADHKNVIEGHESKEAAAKQDCGLLKIFGKKGDKHHQEDATMEDNEQMLGLQQPLEKKEEAKPKHTLDNELHRSSSSSSDEEGDGESKKRKKKGIKEKIKEKIAGHPGEGRPVEHKEVMHAEAASPEEKKGIIEKIKEKIPGKEKNVKDHITPAPAATPPDQCGPGSDGNSSVDGEPKKGILEKIKEKLPGHHKNGEEMKKED